MNSPFHAASLTLGASSVLIAMNASRDTDTFITNMTVSIRLIAYELGHRVDVPPDILAVEFG